MIHTYTHICIYRDGSHTIERGKPIDSMRLVMMDHRNKIGNRADFLEQINRWNRQAIIGNLSGLTHIYVAE